MAARGISLYAKKQTLVDPLFYAQKQEEQVSFIHIKGMVKEGLTFDRMKRMHPEADAEDLRLRGIKAVEALDGDNTISMLDRQGVDATVKIAEMNVLTKTRILKTLNDSQKSSFIPEVKVQLLRKRINDIKI